MLVGEGEDPCPGSLWCPPSLSLTLPLFPLLSPIFRFCSSALPGAKLDYNDTLGTAEVQESAGLDRVAATPFLLQFLAGLGFRL